MRIPNLLATAALVACCAGAPRASAADDLKTVARATAAKSAKSVVTLKIVVHVKGGAGQRGGGGGETDVKLEVVGTVIDPSGLTVASASAIEPMAGRGGGGGRGGAGRQGGAGAGGIESEVREAAIVLEDGTEVEADVVLKDADLDLAFIRPREPQKLESVTLKARGKAPEVLEDIFCLARLGRVEGRASAVVTGQIIAAVKGPRTCYVCTNDISAVSQGCIAYAADGAPLGIFVVKTSSDAGRGRQGAALVLRPIDDVLDIVKQAKEAKTPERKPVEADGAEKKDGASDKTEKKDGAAAPEKKDGAAEKKDGADKSAGAGEKKDEKKAQ